jgi:hypothetical protein
MPSGLKIRASRAALQRRALFALGLVVSLAASAADADAPSAEAAISSADGRIEMASRQSGGAGEAGDQSYALARARLQSARDALKAGREDRAEMLAKEASLLADLTVEKAKLAALQTSHDLVASAASPSPAQ